MRLNHAPVHCQERQGLVPEQLLLAVGKLPLWAGTRSGGNCFSAPSVKDAVKAERQLFADAWAVALTC